MALKSIICQDSSQIWVICEVNSEHIPDFALIPVGSFVDVIDGVHGSEFIGVSLDANARIEAVGQEIVHNFKSKIKDH